MCILRFNALGSVNGNMSCANNHQMKVPRSLQDQSAPKVRKPYTITKPREKWTGEEHRKFLEAVKLHGRAWRSVEEHIGTKNAVQIRSHAQKFFNKAARDSTNGNVDSVVEIPAPRPKKKSLLPYPRKWNAMDKVCPLSIHSPDGRENVLPRSKVEEKSIASSASAVENHPSLSDSSVSGPISPASGLTNQKANGEKFAPDSTMSISEDEQIEGKSNPTSPKSFHLFGKAITVTDSVISELAAQKLEIKGTIGVDADEDVATRNGCSNGPPPFFDFFSEMDRSASPFPPPLPLSRAV